MRTVLVSTDPTFACPEIRRRQLVRPSGILYRGRRLWRICSRVGCSSFIRRLSVGVWRYGGEFQTNKIVIQRNAFWPDSHMKEIPWAILQNIDGDRRRLRIREDVFEYGAVVHGWERRSRDAALDIAIDRKLIQERLVRVFLLRLSVERYFELFYRERRAIVDWVVPG